ncbi:MULTISPECIES: hypothetical protein [Sphingobium]|uniref:hypothetical protein n=1 Tax=Sphingobium TaxID=165695 RepID=UPI0015EB95E4|nr:MULTISPECIES: hypothetical protein [Sphingobium]MCW2362428.1 hypothetical protein [Sphingobium sp. B10D3B]MCW2400893.1 hypothetical protein [Sphingobium sp. B10D7B]MCW2407872.1 hypothetical protein [Sphingobium xanthum]
MSVTAIIALSLGLTILCIVAGLHSLIPAVKDVIADLRANLSHRDLTIAAKNLRIANLERYLEESQRDRGANCPVCGFSQAVPGGHPTLPGTILLSTEDGQ